VNYTPLGALAAAPYGYGYYDEPYDYGYGP
jgi:hypothetical protein